MGNRNMKAIPEELNTKKKKKHGTGSNSGRIQEG